MRTLMNRESASSNNIRCPLWFKFLNVSTRWIVSYRLCLSMIDIIGYNKPVNRSDGAWFGESGISEIGLVGASTLWAFGRLYNFEIMVPVVCISSKFMELIVDFCCKTRKLMEINFKSESPHLYIRWVVNFISWSRFLRALFWLRTKSMEK